MKMFIVSFGNLILIIHLIYYGEELIVKMVYENNFNFNYHEGPFKPDQTLIIGENLI